MENQVMKPVDWCPLFAYVRMFDSVECALFLKDVEESGKFYTGHKLTDDGELVVDTNYRNCQTAHYLPGEEVYEKIATRLHERIAFINSKYGFDLFPEKEQLVPVININRYEGCGDNPARIGLHSDFGPYEDADNRKLSMSILLNDPKEFQGGRFRIFDGGVHHPLEGKPQGSGVIFPSFAIHGVEPVMEGVRYTAVVWFRGPRFR